MGAIIPSKAAVHRWKNSASNVEAIFQIDLEIFLATALLMAVATIGLATVGDYGISVDEFNADDYGPRAFAWYTSGFRDRSMFTSVEDTLWYYGPWFQMAIAWAQSIVPADPWTIRHVMTFLAGMLGIAALLPIGRLAVGRWAGLAAIVLCLSTGYLYGSLFFTPIDVPFLLAMTWATLAIMVMARQVVPSWPATLAAGISSGLAIATRSSGIIIQIYLLGAMLLCALEALAASGNLPTSAFRQIAARTFSALIIAWITAFALWPWLQIGNPIDQFTAAFVYFAHHPASFEITSWGRTVVSTNLPWSYIPEQLVARLPEAFLILLLAGMLSAGGRVVQFVDVVRCAGAEGSRAMIETAIGATARARASLVLWAAVLVPTAFIIVARSTLYDGIRHVLFLIPLLGVIAGAGLVSLRPLLGRFPLAASLATGLFAGVTIWNLAVLHPLEYVATNSLAGGVWGAYRRFDLDYWAAAANPALRRLEQRLDYERSPPTSVSSPSIAICVASREALVAPMFRRPWRLETDPAKADYIIATERWPCAEGITDAILIDEVKRFGRAFAWTYVRGTAGGTTVSASSGS